ncbi:MAG: hypothetical protein AAGN66_02300 [Acidobacteriota bacterium]
MAGYTLLEVLVAAAVALLTLTLIYPHVRHWGAGIRVGLAAREVAASFGMARLYAIRHGENVAVKFRTDEDGVVTMGLYRDGDGDGVRNKDIDWGIDPEERRPVPLQAFDGGVRFGFPSGGAPRRLGGTGTMGRLDDPIRFNRSDLASFSVVGTATPGTVYLTDGERHLMAVRVTDQSGRVTLWRYDRKASLWRKAG